MVTAAVMIIMRVAVPYRDASAVAMHESHDQYHRAAHANI